jgi:hypothetical protein
MRSFLRGMGATWRPFHERTRTFDLTEVGCVQYRIFSFDYGWSLLLTPPERMSASGSGMRSIDLDSPRKVIMEKGSRFKARQEGPLVDRSKQSLFSHAKGCE